MEKEKVAEVKVEETETKKQEPNKVIETEVEKKYTDDDLNNLLVKDRASFIKKEFGIDDPKKVKEFVEKMKADEEANKTELQKKEEELQAVMGDLNAKDQQIFDLNAKWKATELGIKSDFIDEAIVLAKARTTEEKDFDTALSEVVSKFEGLKDGDTFKIGAEPKQNKDEPKKQKNWF